MIADADTDTLKPIIIDNRLIEGYSISKNGVVYSHYRRIGEHKVIDYQYRKKIKTRIRSNYLCCDICFESGKLDYRYRTTGSNNNKQRKTCCIHQLVIDAWKPFAQYLPKGISRSDYNKTPESIKKLLPRLYYINHKDHNKLNNNIDNLERVTPRENSRKAKKHYKGNFANNKKEKV